jgi:hypothetical protein
VSLFSIQVSKASPANGMAVMTENYSKFLVRAVVRFLPAEGACQSEVHRRSVTVRPERFQPNGSVCCAADMKMAEWNCMMMQRNTEADQGPRTVTIIVHC